MRTSAVVAVVQAAAETDPSSASAVLQLDPLVYPLLLGSYGKSFLVLASLPKMIVFGPAQLVGLESLYAIEIGREFRLVLG